MKSTHSVAQNFRTPRRPRQGFALKRLCVLLAAGFMSGPPAFASEGCPPGAVIYQLLGLVSGPNGPGYCLFNTFNTYAPVIASYGLQGATLINYGNIFVYPSSSLGAFFGELYNYGSLVVPANASLISLGGTIGSDLRRFTGKIINTGQILNSGTITTYTAEALINRGVIDNRGLYFGVTTTAGGVLNNQAGGIFHFGGQILTVGAGHDTINMLAGSRLSLSGASTFQVADGYRQVNAGAIYMAEGAVTRINGELQIGVGGTTGGMTSGQVDLFRDTSVLSFDRSDDNSFSTLAYGPGQLVKRNANTLTLTADNRYTGRTQVEAGTLALAGTDNSQDHVIAQGAVLELQVASGNRDGAVATRFSGQGTLRKTGAGLSVWTGSAATFAMAAGSLIEVEGGSLAGGSFGNEDWTLNQSALNVAAGASFVGVEANVRVDALSGAGRITSGYAGAGYTAFTIGVANGSGDFAGELADSSSVHVGRFVKVGSGTQTLSGASTYTGGTTITGGTLQIGNGGTSGSIIGDVINNALLRFNRADDLSFAGRVSGSGALSKLGAGTLTLSGDHTYTGGTSVLGGTLVLAGRGQTSGYVIGQGAVLELRVDSGGRDGTVSTQFSGQGTLRKTGAGSSSWDTSSATFALAAGSLIDVQAGSFFGGFGGNEDWRLNQSALHVAAGASFVGIEANVRVDGLSGAGRISSGFNGLGYTAFTIGVANGSGDFSGVLADSSPGKLGHFVKVGSGTQVLSGINTYSGGTALAGGVLSVARDANLGSASGSLSFAGGTLRNTGAIITSRQVTLGEGDGVFDTAGGYLTINSNVSGIGRLGKTGGDILTLTGAQGYTGATVISAGSLKFAANGATASSVASPSITIASGARLIFADSQTYAGTITGAGQLVREFDGTTTLTGKATHTGGTLISGGILQVGDGGTLAGDVVNNGKLVFSNGVTGFSGNISGSGGVESLGTLSMIGTQTYSGATNISAGGLQLLGSALNSAFTIGAGGRLTGDAQVGTLVVAGGLMPGSGVGKISARDTTFVSGGNYFWKINDGSGLDGIGHDLLSVDGTLSVDAGPDSRFTITLYSLLGETSPGDVIHFDANVNHSYTLVSTSGGILGFSADEFAIDSRGFSNATYGGQWSVAVSGQDLTLNFTAAVPEPDAYALMLAGLLAVGAAARRQPAALTSLKEAELG